MAVVKVGWSGGKDSTATVLLHIERGDKVKAVCYIPMFTEEIPLILKDHYQFILNTADYFRSLGAEIFIVSGITYYDYVLKRSTRGKNKGQIFGFPYFFRGQCGFKRDSKIKACNECDVGYYDYESLGIAWDEKSRHNQLNDKRRSILVEEKYTQTDCALLCLDHDCYSPVYDNQKRDGCALCFNAKADERKRWFLDYPEAFNILLHLQDVVRAEKPDLYPLRDYKWFIEPNYQLSMFEEIKYIVN
jgi:hypothetical protein